jgi:hypothetical protein
MDMSSALLIDAYLKLGPNSKQVLPILVGFCNTHLSLSLSLLLRVTLDEGARPKKWQIEDKPKWHLFWRENQLVGTKKQC